MFKGTPRLPTHIAVELVRSVSQVGTKGNRTVIRAQGTRAKNFLQNLLTNPTLISELQLRDPVTGTHLFMLDIDSMDDDNAVMG